MTRTIRGYGCIFGREFQPADSPTPIVVQRGAFDLSLPVPILLDHDPRFFVTSSRGAMTMWQDSTGLAFELDADAPHFDFLADEVERGRRACLSACFPSGRTSEYQVVGGQKVEFISRTRVEELSFLNFGACPGAGAWITIDGYDLAPPSMADEQRRWRAGYQQQVLSSLRRKSPPPSEPAGLVPLSARAPSGRGQRSPSSRGLALSPQLPARKPSVPASLIALMASADWPKLAATVERPKPSVPASVERLLRLRDSLASGNEIIGHGLASVFPEVALQLARRN